MDQEERLSKLVARFADENDYEVLAAARAFSRIVKAEGKNLSEISVVMHQLGTISQMHDAFKRRYEYQDKIYDRLKKRCDYYKNQAARMRLFCWQVRHALRDFDLEQEDFAGAIIKFVSTVKRAHNRLGGIEDRAPI